MGRAADRSRRLRRLALVAALAPALVAASAKPPTVRTDLGAVTGRKASVGEAFQGIPYAAPPIGPLRWRPPQPAKPSAAPRPATAFGSDCPQPGGSEGPQSEDCLTLSVFTPDHAAKGLPVLVWIHGGAFFKGSGRLTPEQTASIVKRGIVLVTLNYRIGRLGFFAHPALDAPADGAGFGNYWLMDQVAALQWVKRNIAGFGGDPREVTLLGCSAGGSSVAALVASPQARGLFARASVHSGGGLFNATHPLSEAEGQGKAFAERVGVTGEGPQAAASLRALSVDAVLKGDPGPPNFGAIIDGKVLVDQTSAVFARGQQAPVPFISGSTSNEASVFGLMGFDKAVLKSRFGVDLDALRPAYDPDGKLSDAELLRQVQTDFIFTSAGIGMAELAARNGRPAWSYYFDYVASADQGKVPGVPHCGDIPYAFEGRKDASPEDADVGRKMQDYLVNFVKTGDPNGPGLPAWPKVAPGAPATLVVGRPVRAETGFRARQLAPWYAKWSADTGLAFRQ